MAVLIIAEAGVNHEGRQDQARQLIDIAAEAGADVFKSQTFTAEEVVTLTCPPAIYQVSNVNAQDQFSMLKKLELPYEWHAALKAYAEEKGLEFLSTAFGFQSFDFLMNLGLKRIKIPSGEISNLPFVVYQARQNTQLILSTGMADMAEVRLALGAVICGHRPGTDVTLNDIKTAADDDAAIRAMKGKVTILHCTTDYPVLWDQVNMRALPDMREKLGLDIGYSDHTPGLVASYAAVALGATLIEKHYTVSRSWAGQPLHPSPDHQASLEPIELKALVEGIRLIETQLKDLPEASESERMALVRETCLAMEKKHGIRSELEHLEELMGTTEKMEMAGAHNIAKVAKRSLVAARPIKAGEIFTADSVAMKRPAGGLASGKYFDLIGRTAMQDYNADDFILATELPA